MRFSVVKWENLPLKGGTRYFILGLFVLLATIGTACARSEPTPTSTRTLTPVPTPTSTPTIKPTLEITVTPTSTPNLEPTPTATPTPLPTATPTPTPIPSPTLTLTPKPTPTPAPTPTPMPTPTPTPLTAADIFSRISPSVAFIETPAWSGSGVLVEGGYVVTNAHVVWPFQEVRVVFPDGSEYLNSPVLNPNPPKDGV